MAAHIRVYRVKEINTAIDILYIRHIGSVVTNNLIITSSPDHIRIKTCQLLNKSKSMPIKYETQQRYLVKIILKELEYPE